MQTFRALVKTASSLSPRPNRATFPVRGRLPGGLFHFADVACWHFSEASAAAVNFRFRCKSGPRKVHVRRGMLCYNLFVEWRLWNGAFWPERGHHHLQGGDGGACRKTQPARSGPNSGMPVREQVDGLKSLRRSARQNRGDGALILMRTLG
jgi:hypothetical protein